MQLMRFSILLLLIAAMLFSPGLCSVEDSPPTPSAMLSYTGGEQFRVDLKAALAVGCAEILVFDNTGNPFDPESLADMVCALLSELTPEYGCCPPDSYSYSDENRSVLLTVRYLSAEDLPEPFTLTPSGQSVDCQFTSSDGKTIAHSDLLGRRALLIFGRFTCANTRSLLDGLYPFASVLKKENTEVIVCTLSGESSDEAASFASEYPLFTCAASDTQTARRMLRIFDPTLTSFVTPLIFLQDDDGALIYHSTGPADEPARLAATALVSTDSGRNVFSLPSGLILIGAEAFEGCTALEEVTFSGSRITEIGERAFKDCTGLKAAIIPDSVESIGEDAFEGCPELTLCCSDGSCAARYAEENGLERISP